MQWIPSRVDPDAMRPLHVQIRQAILTAVDERALGVGDKLPGVRRMAEAFGVHRLTVLKAAKSLVKRGVLSAVPSRGFYVAFPEPRLKRSATSSGPFFEGIAEGPSPRDPGQENNALSRLVEASLARDRISFAAGFPPDDHIPVGLLRPLAARAFRETNRLGYAPPEGHNDLIEAIRRRLAQRGLALESTDRILITSGAQQAISLALSCFFQGRRGLAVESPGYMGVIAACRQQNIFMSPVPVDSGGVHVPSLERSFSRRDAAGLYTVPSYQNPTGVTQQRKRRERILAVARAHNALIIEDDIYADLRFGGRPIVPIKGLPGGERVLYVGSFSKSIAPGLRVGFIVASGDRAKRLRYLKETADISTSLLLQTVAASFLESGGYHRHLLRVRRAYRQRRDAMIDALETHLESLVTITKPKGGMHLWVMPKRAVDMTSLERRAADEGVCFAPGSLFFTDSRQASSFRLNFAANGPERIAEGVRRLAYCLKEEIEK